MMKNQPNILKISPDLEEIFGDELFAFKGGNGGGGSDEHELEPVIVIGHPHHDEDEEDLPEVVVPSEPIDELPDWEDEIPDESWSDEQWEQYLEDLSNASETGVELNPEQEWYLLHKAEGVMALKNGLIASIRVSNMNGLHNGVGDAYRHAYWTFLNTQDFGAAQALLLGISHEAANGGPHEETIMDLTNNQWGANFATNHPGADEEDFTAAFNQALANNEISILVGGRNPV